MARPKQGHRSDEITGYLSEALEPAARASLEAHLEGCQECQTEVAAQRALFAQVNETLIVQPKQSIDAQVQRFEKRVAVERSGKRWRLRWLPIGIAVATALALLAAIVWYGVANRRDEIMAAPRRR